MPEKTFALEPGQPPRLEVSWTGSFKDLALSLDGQPLASFDGPKELKAPQDLALPDGSMLTVQVSSTFVIPELLLTRDGEPIPGSSGDPAVRHAGAWQMVAAIGGLNVVVGLLVEMFGADFLRGIGIGWPSVVSGILYAVLAWFVRGRSVVALGFAVALFALDGVMLVASAATAGRTPPIVGIVARIFFLIPMLRGFAAIRALARPRRRRPSVAPGATRATPAAAARPNPASAVAASSRASATAPSPASTGLAQAPAAARVLSGEAERQRLQLTERLAAPTASVGRGRGALSIKTSQTSADTAARLLRFLVQKIEIGETGISATSPEARQRDVAWNAIGRVVVRQLPPDAPWDAGLLCDLVVYLDGRWQPLRLFTTTLVNFQALGGVASTSRMENLRRLVRHLRERQPALALDPETLLFVDGTKAPARLVNTTQLAALDAVYNPEGTT